MRRSLILILIAFTAMLLLTSPKAEAYDEYIKSLDITVTENEEGNVAIVNIGRYSPFRRYSWFRVGDVIETVDGVKTSIFVLVALQNNQTPHIKFKRSNDNSAERQISLINPVYGVPDYIDYR